MSPDHHTSDRVYRALKADVVKAGFGDGSSLNIASLSRRYGTSATPVREALLRLVGEGLVALPIAGGFAPVRLSASRLRDLYEFNMHLLLMAVRLITANAGPATRHVYASSEPMIEDVFLDLAQSTGNMMLTESVARMNDRLYHTRLIEALRLDNIAQECSTLADMVGKPLRNAIVRYHRRRIRVVDDLTAFRGLPDPARDDI